MQTTSSSLPNGERLLLTPLSDAQSITIFISVPHGSRHETPAQAGLAHFYEHMVFKGAKKYPTAAAISQALDRYGAEYNAFTDTEQTAFYAKIATDQANVALDVISDYLQHATLDAAELDRERGVILEEYKMYWDIPDQRAQLHIGPLVFGETAVGRPVIGDPERIKQFTRDDFVAWRDTMYRADAVTVSVAGAIPDGFAKRIEDAFGALPTGKTALQPETATLLTGGPKIKIDVRDGDQTQLVMGFPGCAIKDDERWIQRVLRTIMGVSMSSRLFTEIRERRGLCYTIRMSDQMLTDTGMVAVTAGLDAKRLHEALPAIQTELHKIATEAPSADELERAKEFIKGSTILSLEDSSTIAQMKANQWMYEHELTTLEERFAKIDAVTSEHITALAAKLFVPEKLGLVLVGPPVDESAVRSWL